MSQRSRSSEPSRFGRRRVIAGVVGFAVLLSAVQLWPRDETRITNLLQSLCAQLNQTKDPATLLQLRDALSLALLPNASLHVTELNEDAEGRAEIEQRAGQLVSGGVPLSFALSAIEVHLSGELARAELDLLVMPRGSGEQRRDLRHTRVRLNKSSGRWRIEAVEVDQVADSLPEARP